MNFAPHSRSPLTTKSSLVIPVALPHRICNAEKTGWLISAPLCAALALGLAYALQTAPNANTVLVLSVMGVLPFALMAFGCVVAAFREVTLHKDHLVMSGLFGRKIVAYNTVQTIEGGLYQRKYSRHPHFLVRTHGNTKRIELRSPELRDEDLRLILQFLAPPDSTVTLDAFTAQFRDGRPDTKFLEP